MSIFVVNGNNYTFVADCTWKAQSRRVVEVSKADSAARKCRIAPQPLPVHLRASEVSLFSVSVISRNRPRDRTRAQTGWMPARVCDNKRGGWKARRVREDVPSCVSWRMYLRTLRTCHSVSFYRIYRYVDPFRIDGTYVVYAWRSHSNTGNLAIKRHAYTYIYVYILCRLSRIYLTRP